MHVRDQTNVRFAYIVYNMSAFSACILYFLVAKRRNCTHWGLLPARVCQREGGSFRGCFNHSLSIGLPARNTVICS